MERPNDKKKGGFSLIPNFLKRQSPEETEHAKLKANVDKLQAEHEEVLDGRRDLKTQIDRLTERARAKKKQLDAASGPKKTIIDRELRSILRQLQGLVQQDDRLEKHLNRVESLLSGARQAMAVKKTVVDEDTIEDIIEATEEAIATEDAQQGLVDELAGMAYESPGQETSTDDMLEDLGLDLDLGEEEAPETVAPQVERVPQREETVPQAETTERISERKRELDRMIAEMEEEDG